MNKNWIAVIVASVAAVSMYVCLLPLTAVLISFFTLLFLHGWYAVPLSLFLPGLLYFLAFYIFLMRGRIRAWFKKFFRGNIFTV